MIILSDPVTMPLQEAEIPICRLHKIFQRNFIAFYRLIIKSLDR
jgi:hypothetical protein